MITGHIVKGEEKIHFNLPEFWEETTLDHIEKIGSKDVEAIELFSILTGLDLDLVKQCRAEEVSFIVHQMNDLFDYDELTKVQGKVDHVILNDVKYNITTDLLSMPSGQWWDIKKIEQMYHDKPIEGIRHILSILLIEDGKTYDYSESKKTYELLKQIDAVTAFKIRSFFLASQVKYLIDSKYYLKKNTRKKILKQAMTNLVGSMVHYLQCITSQKTKALLKGFLGLKKK